jgi:molybdate transport system ATP-binding protein
MKLELNCRHRVGRLDLDVDTAVPLDGITGLFGVSGAGKTSLLRIIAGLDIPEQGTVRFNDTNWQGDNPRTFIPTFKRKVGYVFQDDRLFNHLSVEGNLRYGFNRRKGRIQYDDVIEALDLSPLLERRPESLSGGEKQRVSIGRALLSQPRLLLMDEPVSALDIPRRREVLSYLRLLPGHFNVPMIYVTHAVEEIAQLAQFVIVMSQGKITQSGFITEVFGDSGLTDDIGRWTLLEAKVVEHDKQYNHSVAEVAGQSLIIPGTARAIGAIIQLRIHARDVSLALKRPEQISIRNILEVRITEIIEQPDQAYMQVHLDLNGHRLLSHLTRSAVAELGLEAGQGVYALIKGVTFETDLYDAEK